MNHRHRARRLALQGICCLDAQGPGVMDLVRDFISDSREVPGTVALATELLDGAYGQVDRCDGVLKDHCHHWDLGRLALIDRGILRLAVHELLSGQTPAKVVITEALKLAKEFSTAESPRFINGVLDSVLKALSEGQDGDAEEDD